MSCVNWLQTYMYVHRYMISYQRRWSHQSSIEPGSSTNICITTIVHSSLVVVSRTCLSDIRSFFVSLGYLWGVKMVYDWHLMTTMYGTILLHGFIGTYYLPYGWNENSGQIWDNFALNTSSDECIPWLAGVRYAFSRLVVFRPYKYKYKFAWWSYDA